MDIIFPRTPEDGGSNLAALLAADPGRRAVFKNIAFRLEPDGRLGDRARFYVASAPFRRATLRSVLSATGQHIPTWAREGRAAERQNADFITAYRESYTDFRREVRAEAKAQRRADYEAATVAE